MISKTSLVTTVEAFAIKRGLRAMGQPKCMYGSVKCTRILLVTL